MQPYQTATEEIKRQGELPKHLAQQGASAATAIGGTAVFGKGLAEKALALASNYLPESLAIKAFTKLDPRFGKLITTAMENGQTGRQAIDFIAGKAEEGLQQQQSQDKRNLIEKHSPELHQFIEQEIKKGQTPLQAGARALVAHGKNFDKVIEKLKKEHKTSWEQILEAVYGGAKPAEQNQPPAAQAPSPAPQSAIPQAPAQAQPQTGQEQPQQPGKGAQALMQMLQETNQLLRQGK